MGLWRYCRKGMRPFTTKYTGCHERPVEFRSVARYGVNRRWIGVQPSLLWGNAEDR